MALKPCSKPHHCINPTSDVSHFLLPGSLPHQASSQQQHMGPCRLKEGNPWVFSPLELPVQVEKLHLLKPKKPSKLVVELNRPHNLLCAAIRKSTTNGRWSESVASGAWERIQPKKGHGFFNQCGYDKEIQATPSTG